MSLNSPDLSKIAKKQNVQFTIKPSLQNHYQQIVEQANFSQNNNQEQPDSLKKILGTFRQISGQIQNKLYDYHQLNQAYKQKIQKDFIISFSKVIEKIGTDLMLAEHAYKNIDKQIMMNQRCANLNQDRLFFFQQSTYYKQEYESECKRSQKLKEENFHLIKLNTGINKKLFQKVKQNMFWKQKCRKMQSSHKIPLIGSNFHGQNAQIINTQCKSSQKPFNQQSTQKINQTLTLNKRSKKWTSLGKQKKQDQRLIQAERIQQRKNLFVDIKSQLKNREKINLEAVVNRNCIYDVIRNRKSKSKNQKLIPNNQNLTFQTPRFPDMTSTLSGSNHKKSLNSTFTSDFGNCQIKDISTKRDLYTSMGRTFRGQQ